MWFTPTGRGEADNTISDEDHRALMSRAVKANPERSKLGSAENARVHRQMQQQQRAAKGRRN